MDFILIAAGLVLLFFGGEALVRGAIALAQRLGLSTLVISAVIVGFGTSMPELLVSVRAALADTPAIAIGNVIGSNIANIALIGGLAMVLSPIAAFNGKANFDVFWMVGVAAVIAAIMAVDGLNRVAALGLMALLGVYVWQALRRDHVPATDDLPQTLPSVPVTAIMLVAGLAGLFAGAELLVRGAVSIAQSFGLSEAVIGLTVVAVGTSLPELATTVVAAMRRHGDVAIGNILGSIVFNIVGILGVTAAITPISLADTFSMRDTWIMLGVTLVFAALMAANIRLGRLLGLVFLGAYVAYTATLLAA